MNLEKIGAPIAILQNSKDQSKTKILYVNAEKEDVVNYIKEYKAPSKEQTFQQIPNITTERQILYVTGASGSGKSYFTKAFTDQYKKIYPKREVYLFSSISDDSSIDKVKNLKRIKLTQEFLQDEITVQDFKDSLVIFDDTDVILDKKMKLKITGILNSILETGRHFNVSCIYTSHVACDGRETKRILNEAHSITIFPHGLGGRSLKYLLDSYLGLDKEQIKRIKKLQSRWVSILKTFPMVILSEKEAFVLNTDD
jgi:energy-coupling factor transporter ATP-binding protein EcfA2